MRGSENFDVHARTTTMMLLEKVTILDEELDCMS